MAHFTIKKGMDLRLEGRPSAEVEDARPPRRAALDPRAFRVKPRLDVKEGDRVRRGTPLFHDKGNEQLRGCAPGAGKVTAIKLGPRRVVESIEIELDGKDTAEAFDAYTLDRLRSITRDQVLSQLQASGYLVYLRQRPFAVNADPQVKPKSIFVNGAATAPFRTDVRAALAGQEDAFLAGLLALRPLTDGPVNLILHGSADGYPDALRNCAAATVHSFAGPHPAGNDSVHIHHLDPIVPGDVVWTVAAEDLIQIGRLFLDGELPATRVVALGGPGVRPEARRHYRVRVGAELSSLLDTRLVEGELRLINGDVLGGTAVPADGFLPFTARGFTVLPEDRERHFLGWLAPGGKRYSLSPAFLSSWTKRGQSWALGTNKNGSGRAMVLTGLYDQYLPMNIMVDYLVRAVLANDTDEAIKLGILETDPEDFALCRLCLSLQDGPGGHHAQGPGGRGRGGAVAVKGLLETAGKIETAVRAGRQAGEALPRSTRRTRPSSSRPADVTRGAPHVRDAIDIKRVMIMVVLALIPCMLFGMFNAGRPVQPGQRDRRRGLHRSLPARAA